MKRIIFLTLLLVVIGIIAYLLQGFFTEYLLLPMILISQIILTILGALPQQIYWAVLLIVLLIIILKGLRRPHLHEREKTIINEDKRSQAITWKQWIQRAENGTYSSWVLTSNLANLCISIYAHQNRLSFDETKELLRIGHLNIPADMQAYLQDGLKSPTYNRETNLLNRMWIFRRSSLDSVQIMRIVDYFEKEFYDGESVW